jgi:diacylglycerol kinase family enzyme
VLGNAIVHAAVIANPHAGTLRRNPALAAKMRDLCGDEAELCLTDDADALTRTAEHLDRARCQHLAIVGGDGTATAVLTPIARAYGGSLLPTVSFLRGGTMNTVANGLGVGRGAPLELLRATLAAWRTPIPRTRPRPVMLVGDRLGFLFGTGVWHTWLNEYYVVGNGRPTPLTAARVFGGAVASALVHGPTYQRLRARANLAVRFEGGSWQTHDYMTVCAGTIDQAGLGFGVFHRAFEADDRFHLIAIAGGPANVARDLPGLWVGRGLKDDTAHHALTRSAQLVGEDGQSFGYSVDGDLYEAPGQLTVSLGPTFRFLYLERALI